MPSAVDAERMILGGLLTAPDRLAEVLDVVKPGDFYRGDHQRLLELLVSMDRARQAIDTVTVAERVAGLGADGFGGIAYVVELPDRVPSTTNLVHYAELVAERARQRDAIDLGVALVKAARGEPVAFGDAEVEPGTPIAEILAIAGGALNERATDRRAPVYTGEDVWTVIQKIHEARARGTSPSVKTGLRALDEVLRLHPGDLLVLAARPGMGKTALALTIVEYQVAALRNTVGIFSLEMGHEQLLGRMISGVARVPVEKMRSPLKLTEGEVTRLESAADLVADWHLLIDDRGGLTLEQMRARARQWRLQHPELTMLVIDYLQIAGLDPALSRQGRHVGIGAIATGAKNLAKELGLPVILLSQLSRDLEKRADKRPIPSDLRDSGQIEQDADQIVFIYRGNRYDPIVPETDAEIIIAKNRHGRADTVGLRWDGPHTRFTSWTEQAADDALL